MSAVHPAPDAEDAVEALAAPAAEWDDCLALEGAVARAARRLRMAVEFSDMTLSLARAVHGQALAEVAAAALAREAAAGEIDMPAEAPPPPPVAAAASGAGAGTSPRSPRAPARPAPLNAAALFARLQATFSLCQTLEAQADETLVALEGRLAVARARRDLRLRQAQDLRQAQAEHEARVAILRWLLPVIDEQAATPEEAQDLHDAAWERVRHDPAYADIRAFPPEVYAAFILENLGLNMDWKRWTPDGWARPQADGLFPRPRWSPFNTVSRKPILAQTEADNDDDDDEAEQDDDPPGGAGWRWG